jgi:membrane associated rhomboid family serine protease
MKIILNLRLAFAAIAILWLVYFLNLVLELDLRTFGIKPRNINGLWGIPVAPLLHGDIHHLTANTGVLFILLTVSFSYSRAQTFKAIITIMLLGGGMVWLLGMGGSIHIGASGIIFGLIGYLMCLGLFRRNWKALMISVVIFLLYGGALYSLLVYVPGISWSGHFFGFLSGAVAAWWVR